MRTNMYTRSTNITAMSRPLDTDIYSPPRKTVFAEVRAIHVAFAIIEFTCRGWLSTWFWCTVHRSGSGSACVKRPGRSCCRNRRKHWRGRFRCHCGFITFSRIENDVFYLVSCRSLDIERPVIFSIVSIFHKTYEIAH